MGAESGQNLRQEEIWYAMTVIWTKVMTVEMERRAQMQNTVRRWEVAGYGDK